MSEKAPAVVVSSAAPLKADPTSTELAGSKTPTKAELGEITALFECATGIKNAAAEQGGEVRTEEAEITSAKEALMRLMAKNIAPEAPAYRPRAEDVPVADPAETPTAVGLQLPEALRSHKAAILNLAKDLPPAAVQEAIAEMEPRLPTIKNPVGYARILFKRIREGVFSSVKAQEIKQNAERERLVAEKTVAEAAVKQREKDAEQVQKQRVTAYLAGLSVDERTKLEDSFLDEYKDNIAIGRFIKNKGLGSIIVRSVFLDQISQKLA